MEDAITIASPTTLFLLTIYIILYFKIQLQFV